MRARLALLLLPLIGCSTCSRLTEPLGLDVPEEAEALFEHDGELSPSAPGATPAAEHRLNVEAGTRLVVTVSSSVFDPALRVTLPGSSAPLSNDDWEGSHEHAQLAVLVPQSGAMTMTVTSLEPGAEGRYRLLVRPPMDRNEGGLRVLRPGDVLEDSLGDGAPETADGRRFMPLLAQVDGPAELSLETTRGTAPTLHVLDPLGRGLSARDGRFALAAGMHSIQVVGASAGAAASFRLRLVSGGEVTPTLSRSHHQLPSAAATASLEVGRVVRGVLESADASLPSGESADIFSLQVSQPRSLSFDLASSELDTYLLVIGPSGQHWENDDFGGGTNSSLAIRVPSAGSYRVIATSYRSGETGAYELKVSEETRVAAGPAAPESRSGDLAAGDSTLDSGEYFDEHVFTFPAGQRVTFTARSSAFDTYLIVHPPEGDQLDNDDPAQGVRNAQLSLETVAGRYRVVVTSYESGETGPYELIVGGAGSQGNPSEVVTTETARAMPFERPTITGTLASGDAQLSTGELADHYRLSATAGSAIRLRLESSAFDPYLIVHTPSGRQLDNDDLVSGNLNSGIDLPSAEAGDHTVIVTSYEPGETGAYTLRRAAENETVADGGTDATASRGGGQVYGLFAGISDYPSGVGDLPECANDAIRLAEALRGQGLLTEDRQTLLTDRQVTLGAVRQALASFAQRLGPDDVFLFFFSGHGGQRPVGNDAREIDGTDEFLVLHDEYLVDDELAQLFEPVRARVSMIAIDACHSGGFAKDLITRRGRVGLFSSEEDVLSAVAGQFQAGGYLSHFLRQGVSGAADTDPNDRVLTVGELTHYVYLQFGAHAQDIHMAATYQHLVVDRGAVGVGEVMWSQR